MGNRMINKSIHQQGTNRLELPLANRATIREKLSDHWPPTRTVSSLINDYLDKSVSGHCSGSVVQHATVLVVPVGVAFD